VSAVGLFRRSRITTFLLAVFWLGITAASSASAAEFEVYGAIESFLWQEFNDAGVRVVKESGPLVGLGESFRIESPENIIFDESAEIFLGRVGYDGGTQQGVPTTSTVDYLGLKLKGDVGRTFNITGPYFLEPFAGLGFRIWARHIRNGTTSTGQPVQGYSEQWTTLHASLGARSFMDISQMRRLFVEAGVKLPLYNENIAYLSREGIGPDVVMHPGSQVSLFWEAGMRVDRVKASVFYDSMRFSRSADVAVTGSLLFFQPRSTADIYGLKLSYLF
jgi:hypothetical protein